MLPRSTVQPLFLEEDLLKYELLLVGQELLFLEQGLAHLVPITCAAGRPDILRHLKRSSLLRSESYTGVSAMWMPLYLSSVL